MNTPNKQVTIHVNCPECIEKGKTQALADVMKIIDYTEKRKQNWKVDRFIFELKAKLQETKC